jgi:hypothetical protein
MDRETRLTAAQAVSDAPDFDTEQAAIARARVVDIRPTLPAGAADLYPQWDLRDDPESTRDYDAICKRACAGFDRGARRYVIHANKARAVADALKTGGFVPCVHPSLLRA